LDTDAEKKINVFVAEPCAGWVFASAYDNRKDMIAEMARFEARSNYRFFSGTTQRLMVQYARETMADEALKAEMDYVLWIDDDMIVPKDIFEQLIKTDAELVAPLCFTRRWPHYPVIYKTKKYETEDKKIMIKNESVLDYPENSLAEVDSVGFGVVLMKTSVLKKIKRPWFFVNQAIGEDILFCVKLKEEMPEAKILVDTSIKIGHLGDPEVCDEAKYKETRKSDLYIKWKAGEDAKSTLKEVADVA